MGGFLFGAIVDDHTYFKRNPLANYRVRAPGAGEINALLKRALPPGSNLTAPLPTPSRDTEYRVAVLKIADSKFIRMMILADIDADMNREDGPFDLSAVGLTTIKIGSRIVMAA